MGKFLVRRTATGYEFDLLAANGQDIAASEVYETKAACIKGIRSVQKYAPVAKFLVLKAKPSSRLSIKIILNATTIHAKI